MPIGYGPSAGGSLGSGSTLSAGGPPQNPTPEIVITPTSGPTGPTPTPYPNLGSGGGTYL
jgi:hypothetical protein